MSLNATIEAALADRKGKRVGDRIDFLCVACDDGQNPAAAWHIRREVWGCAKCGQGGPTTDLANRLGIQVESVRERATRSRIGATYDYCDADGNFRFQVVRLIPKDFRQRSLDAAGNWTWERQGNPILYRLPELMASTSRIYIAEGEKDVEAIRERGGTATCNPGGAAVTGKSKWRADLFNHYLKDRDVVIVPDLDAAGDAHAAGIAATLKGVVRSVRIVKLPGLEWKAKKGPDVSDWFAGGAGFDDLEELAASTPEWEMPEARPTQVIQEFRRTDTGNAEWFAHLHGDNVRYDHRRGAWLIWGRNRWEPDPNGQLWRWGIDAARARGRAAFDAPPGEAREELLKWASASESTARIEAMLKQLKSIEPIADRGESWDANPFLLGFENGVVNLATGEFRQGRRDDRVTRSVGYDYDGGANCPLWLKFLGDVFMGNEEMLAFIQRVVGYCVTGLTREQVWFLGHGSGGNGKNTFVDTIHLMLGDYGGDTPAATLVGRGPLSGGQASPDIAALAGKRFITCTETEEMGQLNAGRVKWLTGSNPVTARHLHKDPFTFIPAFKFMLTTNNLPRVDDDSEGFWRRVRLIPFLNKFEGVKRDLDMGEKLQKEFPGIMRWAIQGAIQWKLVGLMPPEAVMLATWRYRQDSDLMAEFIADCCVTIPEARATLGQLYYEYTSWARRQGVPEKEWMSNRSFRRRLQDRFGPSLKSMNNRWYVGIGLRGSFSESRDNRDEIGPPQDSTESTSNFSHIAAGSLTRAWEKTEIDVPFVPIVPLSCPCEKCPLPGDADAGCDGEPFWEDEAGAHCHKCHPRERLI